MRRSLLSFAALAVTALALQGLPAKAQDSTSGSTSSSSSGSTSASTSRSGSSTTSGTSANSQQQRTNQRVNSTTNNTIPITFNSGTGAGNGTNGANAVDPAGANGANGTNGGGGFSNNPPFYSQSDVTVRTTPTVYAPPVSGGNPCTLAVSGGVSVIGWGAAAGGTFVDQDCADRQKIAMIHNAGYAKAAQELMCNDKATYIAFRGTQTPCNPRPQWDGTQPGQPIVQQQPVPLAPPPQQITTIKDRTNLPRCSRTITDNCFAG